MTESTERHVGNEGIRAAGAAREPDEAAASRRDRSADRDTAANAELPEDRYDEGQAGDTSVEADLPEGRFDAGQAVDSELEAELPEGRFDEGQAGSDAINPTHDDLSGDDLGHRDDLGR